jgi:hypothetical protein
LLRKEKLIDNYILAFDNLRKKLYEKYSSDIYEKNSFI